MPIHLLAIESPIQIATLFRLYDMALTQRATLSAMLLSAAERGTHGAAMVDRQAANTDTTYTTRILTRGKESHIENVSAMPTPELWFETLLAKKRKELLK